MFSMFEIGTGPKEKNYYPTEDDYFGMIQKVMRCPTCGTPLSEGFRDWYVHQGGRLLRGYKEKQWLFIHCNGCGYGWSLWKLEKRLERLKETLKDWEVPNVSKILMREYRRLHKKFRHIKRSIRKDPNNKFLQETYYPLGSQLQILKLKIEERYLECSKKH